MVTTGVRRAPPAEVSASPAAQASEARLYIYIYIQYTLANPNSSVPMILKIVRISEFVPISEITLIQWGINYKKFELLEY